MADLRDEGAWDPARLDPDYNARATVGPEGFAAEMARYRVASQKARAENAWALNVDVADCGPVLDLYGPMPRPQGAGQLQPVFVFIHGGYWRALSKDDSAMMAQVLADAGIATAVIDYPLAPAASLAEIVRHVRGTLAWLFHHAAELGLDPTRIHVGGSSAGAHLAAMVLADDWHAEAFLPPNAFASGFLLSGLYELAPIAHTQSQEWLQLDAAQIAQLSPYRHVPENGPPVFIAWAEGEPAGFRRQSLAFADQWQKAGGKVLEQREIAGKNHFDILMELAIPSSALVRALVSQINGAD